MGFQMIFYVIFRYAGQSSKSVILEAGKYYYVVGLQKGTESTDSLSAGVRLPSGRFMRPITKEILQWRLPGKFVTGLLKYRKITKISPSKYKPPQTGNAKNSPLNRASEYKPPGGLYLENCPQRQSNTKQKR